MKITISDYDKAFERFTSDMQALDGIVLSVLRYGSAARGEISPGKSDLMDAYVFVRKHVFESKSLFRHVLESFVHTCQWLSDSGLPYLHPFHYYCEDEVGNLPAGLVGTLTSKDTSDILFGDDIRQQLGSSSASQEVMKSGVFLYVSDRFFKLAHLLDEVEISEEESKSVVRWLTTWSKYLAQSACLALGHVLGGKEALQYLSKEFVEADFTVLEEVRTFRDRHDPAAVPGEVLELLRRVLSLVETLHDEIIERLRGSSEEP